MVDCSTTMAPLWKRPKRSLNLLGPITDAMVRGTYDEKRFLPKDCFNELFSENNVKAALPGASRNLVDFTKTHAIRIFATVIFATEKSGKELVLIMESFRQRDFRDTHLSLDDDPQCGFLKSSQCSHNPVFNVFHDRKLWPASPLVRMFFHDRWKFLAPVFEGSSIRYDLMGRTILPFDLVKQNQDENSVGGFSEVQKAKIRASHQDIVQKVWITSEADYLLLIDWSTGWAWSFGCYQKTAAGD